MNFVVYYMNYDGFPHFCFVQAESKRAAKKEFERFHPDAEMKQLYVDCNDIAYALAHCF